MPLYGFQKRFAAAVKNGTKCRTIRNKRKLQTKIGDTLYMYSGLRTKQSEKLGVFTCLNVRDVTISENKVLIHTWDANAPIQSIRALNSFAQLDGFPDFATMKRWIIKVHGSLPWHCEMIEW